MSRVMEKTGPEVPEYLRAEKKLMSTEKDMSADQKLLGQKLFDQKLFDQKLFDQKLFDQKLFDQKLLNQKLFDQNPLNLNLLNQKLPDEKKQQNSEKEYLSDMELEALIVQIEQQELVMAPPDLKDRILGKVYAEAKAQETAKVYAEKKTQESEEDHTPERERPKEKVQILYWKKQKAKTEEFRRYCFRVWTSVAAAILLIFMFPVISGQNADLGRGSIGNGFSSREAGNVFSYKENRIPDDGESILQHMLGGSRIFGEEDRLNIFR